MRQQLTTKAIIHEISKHSVREQEEILRSLSSFFETQKVRILQGQHIPVTITQEEPDVNPLSTLSRRPVRRRTDRDCLELTKDSICTLTFKPSAGSVVDILFLGAYRIDTKFDPNDRNNAFKSHTTVIDVSRNFEITISGNTAILKHPNDPGTYNLDFTITLESGIPYKSSVLLYY